MRISDLPDVDVMDEMVGEVEDAVFRLGDAYDEVAYDLCDAPHNRDWREPATEEQRMKSMKRLKDALAWLEKRIEVFRKETGLNE